MESANMANSNPGINYATISYPILGKINDYGQLFSKFIQIFNHIKNPKSGASNLITQFLKDNLISIIRRIRFQMRWHVSDK